jgi:hypothetical protein
MKRSALIFTLAGSVAFAWGAQNEGMQNRKAAMSETQAVAVEPEGDGQWRVRVTRERSGHSAEGSVLVRGPKPDPVSPKHLALAGARAWLALADARIAASEWKLAIEFARQGISELGDDYARPEVDDSTAVKILAAEEEIAHDRLSNGARTLARVLANRVVLYVELHRDSLVE